MRLTETLLRGTRADRGTQSSSRLRCSRCGKRVFNCKCTCPGCGSCSGTPCGALSTEADHYPLSRRELVEQGLNPNLAEHGRGLCKPCHSSHTAQAQPGGWNRR